MRDHSNYIYSTSTSIGHFPDNTFGDITFTDHVTNDTALKVDGALEVNGRDVMKELDEMRDALLLLKRDVDMEAKYPRLKELKDEYEAQLEKYKTWEALK